MKVFWQFVYFYLIYFFFLKFKWLLNHVHASREKWWWYSYFFPESRLWHVMRIVSNRDSLYGLSNFIFCCFLFCGGGGGVKILTLNLFHSLGYFSSKKLVIFVEFSPENRIWHFKQIVCNGDALQEMSNRFLFWGGGDIWSLNVYHFLG